MSFGHFDNTHTKITPGGDTHPPLSGLRVTLILRVPPPRFASPFPPSPSPPRPSPSSFLSFPKSRHPSPYSPFFHSLIFTFLSSTPFILSVCIAFPPTSTLPSLFFPLLLFFPPMPPTSRCQMTIFQSVSLYLHDFRHKQQHNTPSTAYQSICHTLLCLYCQFQVWLVRIKEKTGDIMVCGIYRCPCNQPTICSWAKAGQLTSYSHEILCPQASRGLDRLFPRP